MFTSHFRTLCSADELFPPSLSGFGLSIGDRAEAMLRWAVRVIIQMNRQGFKDAVV